MVSRSKKVEGPRRLRVSINELAASDPVFAANIFNTSFTKSKKFDPEVWEFFPPTFREFVESPAYLGMKGRFYECYIEDFEKFFGDGNPFDRGEFNEIFNVTGIGGGKSYSIGAFAAYFVLCILCLRDPATYLGILGTGKPLAPRSKIAIMNCSVNARNAMRVVFGDIKTKIDMCQWFRRHYPPNPRIASELQFDVPPNDGGDIDKIYKCVYIIPGSSSEYAAIGYNIILGILDEANSYPSTEMKDGAEEVYNAMKDRTVSRFGSAGAMACVSQAVYVDDFLERKLRNPNLGKSYKVRRSSWGAKFGEDWSGVGFWFDPVKMEAISPLLGEKREPPEGASERSVYVHGEYHESFLRDPVRAWRDFGAHPTTSVNRFFTKWWLIEQRGEVNYKSPVKFIGDDGKVVFQPWFRPVHPGPYYIHVDASSMSGKDATGIAMTHVDSVTEEGEPVVELDCLIRLQGTPAKPIPAKAIRELITYIRRTLGFPIAQVTYDGYTSDDTLQMSRESGIPAEYLSVDKTPEPYTDLMNMIIEDRFVYYLERTTEEPLETFNKFTYDRLSPTEVFVAELINVEEVRSGAKWKVDHSPRNSKDCSDAVAGAVHSAAKYHRRRGPVELRTTFYG
jgi:hypothetical protein